MAAINSYQALASGHMNIGHEQRSYSSAKMRTRVYYCDSGKAVKGRQSTIQPFHYSTIPPFHYSIPPFHIPPFHIPPNLYTPENNTFATQDETPHE